MATVNACSLRPCRGVVPKIASTRGGKRLFYRQMSIPGGKNSVRVLWAVLGRVRGRSRVATCLAVLLAVVGWPGFAAAQTVTLAPEDTASGYLARLLINEVPFPGERSWVSVEESIAGQEAIIWVLRNRLRNIPAGYTQKQVAATSTGDVIDLLTAGGQVEGFYRDANGRPAMDERVTERVDYLMNLANRGPPGRFARLLKSAQQLADDFVGSSPADPFADIQEIDGVPVTGSAYGWMTDQQVYHPGGNFIRITDQWRGGIGGNRFFTLRMP